MNSIQAPVLRDPTAELGGTRRARLQPPASLNGKTIALLDIGKMRGDEFIDRLDQLIRDRGVATRRYRKPTNAKVAPPQTIQAMVTEADLAIIALSD